jgi:hypothetical protein
MKRVAGPSGGRKFREAMAFMVFRFHARINRVLQMNPKLSVVDVSDLLDFPEGRCRLEVGCLQPLGFITRNACWPDFSLEQSLNCDPNRPHLFTIDTGGLRGNIKDDLAFALSIKDTLRGKYRHETEEPTFGLFHSS